MPEEEKQKNIRNFCIIAHINHGKSTLADRFLELTHTLRKEEMREQVLDQMDLERERGITIKMQPCTMEYEFAGKKYQLNLIDTPGHMDFAYEVERSLSAVEGVILLVDVVSGVQAQTLANLRLAKGHNLTIIPVINKIDVCPSQEQFELVKKELSGILALKEEEILAVSAKTGEKVEEVLKAVVRKILPPSSRGGGQPELRALIFDSFYDNYQGVVAQVRVFSGEIKKGDQLFLLNQKKPAQAREVGMFKPKRIPLPALTEGRIGYVATGVKELSEVKIGETITLLSQAETTEPLPGYQEPKPMVFANLFPPPEQNFEILRASIEKLRLNDNSLNLSVINNPYLGRGLKVGFLGMLHLEITMERLKREYSTEAIITSPSVAYELKLPNKKETVFIYSAAELPTQGTIEYIKEPWVCLDVICPIRYISKVHQLVEEKRGNFMGSGTLDPHTWLLHFKAPLSEIIEDFLDKLKSATEGFASFSYVPDCYQQSDLVKLDFWVSRDLKSSLSKIVHKDKAQREAKDFLKKLKENLPPKNFSQALQAAIGGKIIAREDIKALRKDVTAPLYGGDVTRKRKLLEKQKKGKKRLMLEGKTAIPQEVYLKLLRK